MTGLDLAFAATGLMTAAAAARAVTTSPGIVRAPSTLTSRTANTGRKYSAM